MTKPAKIETALKLANRGLESFSDSVAHHLRSPLRAMNGFAHVLLEPERAVVACSSVAQLAGGSST